MSGGAFNSVSDLSPRASRDYLLRQRFVKTIGFCLGRFNRRIGLGSVVSLAAIILAVASQVAVDGLAVDSLAAIILAVDSLAVVSLAVASLAVVSLAVDGLAVVSLAVVSLAVDSLAVVSLAVADFELTRGKGGRKTGSRCSADLKLG